jgi:hypothetical protein
VGEKIIYQGNLQSYPAAPRLTVTVDSKVVCVRVVGCVLDSTGPSNISGFTVTLVQRLIDSSAIILIYTTGTTLVVP